MQVILEALRSFFEMIKFIISEMGINDILDIVVITFIIYKCIGFFRQSRGGQLIKGIVFLLFAAFIANWLDMIMVNWVMVKVFDSALIAAVIIFQPEIRRVLEQMGTSRFGSLTRSSNVDLEYERMEKLIESVSRAADDMQKQKCGALMVFERTTQLGEIISTGTMVDAYCTSSLVCNIFYPKSPLHDGAMILRGNRIYAAGCILPLTHSNELNKALGTRHRAAIGMSENSDAVVVVVSEETGTISIAVNGELKRGFDAITLRTELASLLLEQKDKKQSGIIKSINQLKDKIKLKTAKNKKENDKIQE